ncbi:unnamed protein product [Boreogadus saida]
MGPKGGESRVSRHLLFFSSSSGPAPCQLRPGPEPGLVVGLNRCGGRRVSQAGSINYTTGEVFLQRCCTKMPGALKAREKTYELVPGSGDGSGGRPGPAFKGSQLPAEHLRASAFQSILHTLHKVRGPWGPGQHLTPAQDKEEDVLFVYLVLADGCTGP